MNLFQPAALAVATSQLSTQNQNNPVFSGLSPATVDTFTKLNDFLKTKGIDFSNLLVPSANQTQQASKAFSRINQAENAFELVGKVLDGAEALAKKLEPTEAELEAKRAQAEKEAKEAAAARDKAVRNAEIEEFIGGRTESRNRRVSWV